MLKPQKTMTTPAKDPKQASKAAAAAGSAGGGRNNFGIFGFFIFVCRNFGPEPLPERPDNPSGHFEPVSATPDHSQPILQHFYITKSTKHTNKLQKKRGGYPCFPFLKGISPWDHAHLKENKVSRSRDLARALYDHSTPPR